MTTYLYRLYVTDPDFVTHIAWFVIGITLIQAFITQILIVLFVFSYSNPMLITSTTDGRIPEMYLNFFLLLDTALDTDIVLKIILI